MRTRHVLVLTAAAASVPLLLAGCGGGAPADRTASPPAASVTAAPRTGGAAPAVLTAGPAPAGSATAGRAGTITTAGTGTVSGAPDTMTVSIDVSTSDPHAAGALSHNNAVAAAVQQALIRDGVASKDIQTTGLSLQQTSPPSPAGYQVDDQVAATLRNLARAGSVIDDAVSAAGDAGRLDSVGFTVSDASPLMAVARQQAVAAARTQAEQLAAAAGEHLGALVSLTDQSSQSYPMPYGVASSVAPAAAAVPVRPGTQQLSVAVTAVWAVGP